MVVRHGGLARCDGRRVHDRGQLHDVQAPRGDIRGDEDPHPFRLEVRERAGLRAEVSVQCRSGDASAVQLQRAGVRALPAGHEGEDVDPLVGLQELAQQHRAPSRVDLDARWTMRFAEGIAPASMGTRAGRTPRSAAPPRDSCARRLLVPLPGVLYLLSAGPPIRTPGSAVSARPSSRHWRAFRLLGRAQLPTPPVGWPTHNFSATGLGAAPPESGNSRRPVQEHALRGDHQQGNSLAGWGAIARGCAKIGPPTRHVTLRDAQGHSETGLPEAQLLAFAAVSFTARAGESTTKHTGSSSFPGTFTRSYFTITLPGAPSRVFSGMR